MTIADVLADRARWHVSRAESLSLALDLDDGIFDAIITDPPYSSGGQFRGDRAQATGAKYVMGKTKIHRPDFSGDTRDQRSFQLWCALFFGECLRLARVGAPLCVFTDWRQLAATIDAIQIAGWIFRGVVPWDKTEGCRPQKGRFASQCEFVVWGSSGAMAESRDVGCLPGIVRSFPNPREKHHQTGKPVDLMQAIVRIAPPNGIVFDPFAGSASTGVACLREGRRFVGVELVEEYYSLAREAARSGSARPDAPGCARGPARPRGNAMTAPPRFDWPNAATVAATEPSKEDVARALQPGLHCASQRHLGWVAEHRERLAAAAAAKGAA